MTPNRESRLAALLRLPWTVRVERSDEGYFVARCAELPGSIATGSKDEIEGEFWESMRATLGTLLDDGDRIPLPNGVKILPWEVSFPRWEPTTHVSADNPEAFTQGSGSASTMLMPA